MAERILVVEDDAGVLEAVVTALRASGMDAEGVPDLATAGGRVASASWDALVVDMRLPDGDGIEFATAALRRSPLVPVIIMSAHANVDLAIAAVKRGVTDFIKKPFEEAELVERLRRACVKRPRPAPGAGGFARLVGRSPALLAAIDQGLRVAASSRTTVLVAGESGTGKDLLARAIHEESARASAPFVNITCTAIADTLFESELFGHERGSFTGADAMKKGLLEVGDGGTIFLDEVGELTPGAQGKLLRFLEERTFKRVGGERDVSVDVRVVAATNRRLHERVAAGAFRADLYHRLNVVAIDMPPLREREGDAVLLARTFLARLAPTLRPGLPATGFTPDALACIELHRWPGNVRELRNAIERALILGRTELIETHDLPFEVARARSGGDEGALAPDIFTLPPTGIDLERLERELVRDALGRSAGNKTRAAKLLGLTRDQVRYRLKKMGEATER